VLVLEGLTVFEITFVSAASLYQVVVPMLHVAAKVELCPEQIVDGLAEILVAELGLTVLEVVIESPASVYQVGVPVLQEADKVELFPEHIVEGLAEILVGAAGVIFVSDTETFVLRVHPLASRLFFKLCQVKISQKC
jgi:hypothetical protein